MVNEKTGLSTFRKFLFGSIGKKLGLAFGILIIILITMLSITYSLSQKIQEDQILLKNVEAPLSVMVEQVIGYDAILTGTAHEALLHAEKGELNKIAEHKKRYEEIGVELDTLLKIHALELLNQSKRSEEDKQKVYGYLKELDIINLALVDLELRAFEAMEKGDIETARNLIVSDQYQNYKLQLADYYQKWSLEEIKISDYYREEIQINSRNVQIYNLYLGVLLVLIACLIPFIVSRAISRPIRKLTESVRELERGNFKTRVEVKTNDELQELADSFNKTAETLGKVDDERKQIDKAKTEFLSITSHELRSPMTPMQAQLQMLMQGYFGKLSAKEKESLDIVLRNTQRLDRIIQDFLEISRIEAARLKFNFVRVDLSSSVKKVVEEIKGFMPEKKIKIHLEMSKLPTIEVDPDRVMQVLRNLLTNAVKFSKENKNIWIYIQPRQGDIIFTVKDEGVGIKRENQARIFEPFYQVDNMYQHQSGGTGLGLAICKGIVESQNGKIWFNSEEGKGTTFYFTIPFVPVKEMKPIKLLFSSAENVEKELKKVFLEILGPLGEKEFEDLRIKGLIKEDLLRYVDELYKKKIIRDKEEFKNKIALVFGAVRRNSPTEKKRGVDLSDLKKRGLVK